MNAQPVTVEYRDIYQLMHHLRGMGETNSLNERRQYVSRKTFEEANRLYKVELLALCKARKSILLQMAESMQPSNFPFFRAGLCAKKQQ